MSETYDYFIQQIGENLWKIYKVDTLHYKIPSATYEVKKLRGRYYCDCPAPGFCKHIDMIKINIQPKPKKNLF